MSEGDVLLSYIALCIRRCIGAHWCLKGLEEELRHNFDWMTDEGLRGRGKQS